jgi:hypothetical protein
MQTIWLEFRHENGALAANGSDVTTFLDGRWNFDSCLDAVHKKLADLRKERSKYNKQLFVGYKIAGLDNRKDIDVLLPDPNPPEWAVEQKSQS